MAIPEAERRALVGTLNSLVEALNRRLPDVNRFEQYYSGGQGRLVFASDQFAEYFAKRYSDFADNWCGVVADAPTERLQVTGVRPVHPDGTPAEPDRESWRVWRENDAEYFSDQAFLDSIVGTRAYALVWGNPEDEQTPLLTFEHPAQAIVGYDPDTRQRRAGLKLWSDDVFEYATLYLPDAVYKWERVRRASNAQTASGLHLPYDDQGWQVREVAGEPWPLPNPLGRVPLVELPNRPRLAGEPRSDIAGVVAMQDAINLLWSYLLNAADFASFPQRVVLNAERPKVPILDESGQVVGERDVELDAFAVNRVVWLEDPNAKVGEWSATNLGLYTQVLETCVSHIAAQSRTPPHYLMSKIVNANAETLKTAETGLVKRTQEKTQALGRGVRQGFELIALAQGNAAKAKALRGGETLWADVEIRSEAQAIDAAQKLRAMGYPLEYVSRRIGMTPDEIVEVMAMREREAALDPLAAVGQQLDVTQGGLPPGDPQPAADGTG